MRLFTLIPLIVLFSCSGKDKDGIPGTIITLTPFQVTVSERAATKAIIKWTSSENLRNGDVVKYRIMLNDQIVKNDALKYTDTLLQLKPDITYHGRVIAYTQLGDTTSVSFTLERIDGYIISSNYLEMYCLELTYGRVAWADMNYSREFHFNTIPVVENDVVYKCLPYSGVAAYSLKTGEKLWLVRNDRIANEASPVYRDQTLYTVGENGVFALNSLNGQIKWQYPYSNPGNSSYAYTNLLLAGNLLISGKQNLLTAINIETHLAEWTYASKSQMCAGPAYYKDLVIITTNEGMVHALNSKTGVIVWTRDFSRTHTNFGTDRVSPIIMNDRVFIFSGNTGYYALNAKTGATIWNIEQYNAGSATIGDGLIYYSYNAMPGNHVKAVDALTGRVVWDRYTNGGSPIFVNGKLYASGNVLDPKTGDFITPLEINESTGVIISKGITYYPAESGMLN